MKGFVNMLDGLPKWAKVVLAFPMLDIVWCIYRICRSAAKKNVLGIVLGVLTIIPGSIFVWVCDLITTCLQSKVLWID